MKEEIYVSLDKDDQGWDYAQVTTLSWEGVQKVGAERLYAYPELMRGEPVK
jgi:hypothetical protein